MREPITARVYQEDGVFWWQEGTASYAAGTWDRRIMQELARELREERARHEAARRAVEAFERGLERRSDDGRDERKA